jgi:hypothetical protein
MHNLMQFVRDRRSSDRQTLASMAVSPVRASLSLVIALLAVLPVVRFAIIAFARVNDPFDLEWILSHRLHLHNRTSRMPVSRRCAEQRA